MKCHDATIEGIACLSQNRLAAGLSLLGTFVGIASVLCMIAIGDGAKEIIEKDIETLGGANQMQFWTRVGFWKRGRLMCWTTERYTLENVYAIEVACPDVLFVLPKISRYRGSTTSRHGGQARPYVKGVTEVSYPYHTEIGPECQSRTNVNTIYQFRGIPDQHACLDGFFSIFQ